MIRVANTTNLGEIFKNYWLVALHIVGEMQWPQFTKIFVENILTASFLTKAQKEYIFYNNAAKFNIMKFLIFTVSATTSMDLATQDYITSPTFVLVMRNRF